MMAPQAKEYGGLQRLEKASPLWPTEPAEGPSPAGTDGSQNARVQGPGSGEGGNVCLRRQDSPARHPPPPHRLGILSPRRVGIKLSC